MILRGLKFELYSISATNTSKSYYSKHDTYTLQVCKTESILRFLYLHSNYTKASEYNNNKALVCFFIIM